MGNSKILLLAALLGGCTTVLDEMMDNDFPAVEAVPAGHEISGMWVGSAAYHLVSLSIEPSGHGLSCYSTNGNDHIGRIKYDGRSIVYQEGVSQLVVAAEDGKLILRAPYRGAKDLTFHRDDDLAQASPYCQKELQQDF